MQFARLNDVNLHYQVISAPEDKPTLVFANSLGTDFRIWRDVIIHFVGQASIVMYDKRGHGLSETGEMPYALDDHVDDLAALLDHLGVSSAVICGLSVGGLIAQGLYHARPDLVSGLILCGTAAKIGDAELWNNRISEVEQHGLSPLLDGILEKWFTPNFHANRPADLAGYRAMLARCDLDGYLGTCAALRDADLRRAALDIKAPCIAIVGDQDGSTPPDLVMSTAKLIPDCRYEVIKGAAHIPCVEQPDMLVDIINAYLKDAGLV